MLTRLLRIDKESIREAAATILKGGLVVYPTDTVYGLGCNPFDKEAVNKVADVKRRIKGNFPVLVETIEKAKELGEVDVVLDGGSLAKSPESTVVRATSKRVDILREGAVSRQEIVMALKAKVGHRD